MPLISVDTYANLLDKTELRVYHFGIIDLVREGHDAVVSDINLKGTKQTAGANYYKDTGN